MYQILLVDDDRDILALNQKYFEKKDFYVDVAENVQQTLMLFNTHSYDCMVLDVKMDGPSGYDFCRFVREKSSVPILFLTCMAEEECIEEGFLSGGDDYLAKPYSFRELELRVRARIRAYASEKKREVLSFSCLKIDVSACQAYIEQKSLQLTNNEFEILLFLAENQGTPFSQNEIYSRIWGDNGNYNSHSVQTLIVRIRRKIAALAPDKDYIKTIWGKGYLFIPQ